jgi:hypothetical protein
MLTLHVLGTQRGCKKPTWPKQLTFKSPYNKTNQIHQFPKYTLVLFESCLQTCMTYTIAESTVNKLLMMDRGTFRNM